MIDEIVFLATLAIGAVALTTLLYNLLPFYTHTPSRPSIILFPKYQVTFSEPVDEIQKSLVNLKFSPSNPGSLTYARGKAYGDFSAKHLKLRARIEPDSSTLFIYAPYMGVLFDTGDLWQLTDDILKGARNH